MFSRDLLNFFFYWTIPFSYSYSICNGPKLALAIPQMTANERKDKVATYDTLIKKKFKMGSEDVTNSELAEVLLYRTMHNALDSVGLFTYL